MKIGVISDTHARNIDQLSRELRLALANVDLIVHAGDITEKATLDGLLSLGEVKAVRGNMDTGELKEALPPKLLFEANGKTIGVTHGSGAPWGIAERVRKMFTEEPDIIIFGHSHHAEKRLISGTLMINPGSGS